MLRNPDERISEWKILRILKHNKNHEICERLRRLKSREPEDKATFSRLTLMVAGSVDMARRLTAVSQGLRSDG